MTKSITVHHGSDDTVCNGDILCQWNTRFSDPQGTKTNKPIDIKLHMGYYIGDITTHARFGGKAAYA